MIVKVIPTREKDEPTYVRIFRAFSSVLKNEIKNSDSILVKEEGYTPTTWINEDVRKIATSMLSNLIALRNQCMHA